MLFVENGTTQLAAFDSVTFARGPFTLTNTHNFSVDQRTRIIFFSTDLGFPQATQPDIDTLSVQIGGNSYAVESAGPDATIGASYIVFRLPDLAADTYPLSIRVRGVNSINSPTMTVSSSPSSPASNKLRITEYFLYPVINFLF
jgi:hypothetical protein